MGPMEPAGRAPAAAARRVRYWRVAWPPAVAGARKELNLVNRRRRRQLRRVARWRQMEEEEAKTTAMPPNNRPTTLSNQPIKLSPQKTQPAALDGHLQRTLASFLCVYAILILGLYLTYAAYHHYQQHQLHQQQHQQHQQQLQQLHKADQPSLDAELADKLERKLDSRLHLLERYLEVLAADLQETKSRLREREKCDCSQSCTFNGTRYADQSSWQHLCDTCTCQLGRISCSPRKCPPLPQNCDAPVQPPGKCCPICMKSCSYNKRNIKHGDKFRPLESAKKECKCMDGLIVCEPSKARSAQMSASKKAAAGKLEQTAQEKPTADKQIM